MSYSLRVEESPALHAGVLQKLLLGGMKKMFLRLLLFVFFTVFVHQNAFSSEVGQGLLLRYCVLSKKSGFPIRLDPIDYLASKEQKSELTLLDRLEDLSPSEQKKVLLNILQEYVTLYVSNEKVFFPYYQKDVHSLNGRGTMLYRHLCQDKEFKPHCKPFKGKLVEAFEEQLQKGDLRSKSAPSQNTLLYFQKINQDITRLREVYLSARRLIDDELSARILDDKHRGAGDPVLQIMGNSDFLVKTFSEYNHVLKTVLSLPEVHLKLQKYNELYLELSRDLPGRVMLTDSMRRHIEGAYFDIQFEDLVLFVDESTHELRKIFMKLVETYPTLMSSVSLVHHDDASTPPLSSNCESIVHSWVTKSELFPKYLDNDNFQLVKSAHIHDIQTLRFIADHQYQSAIWRLRDLKSFQSAQVVEDWVNQFFGNPEVLLGMKNLGGGGTTTKLTEFSHFMKGVFKPKATLEHLGQTRILDFIAEDYRKEIAAYRVDRLLGLNLVPMTKEVRISKDVGSLQYYVHYSTAARLMNPVDMVKTVEIGKWHTPEGRIIVPRNLRFFDWLINNRDRNVDNYLFRNDGRIVPIDHGWSFIEPLFFAPSDDHLAAMIPSHELYQRIKDLNSNPELVDTELKDLLSQSQLQIFKHRLHYFVSHVEERIQKEGLNEVFKDADFESSLHPI